MSLSRLNSVLLAGLKSPGSQPRAALQAYQNLVQAAHSSAKAGARRIRYQPEGAAGTAAKKTLKERLMSPTSGMPIAVGQMALGVGAAVGTGALALYGLGLGSQSGAVDKYGLWPEYVRERIHSTYAYLGASLGVTAGSAVAASRVPAILRIASSGSLLAIFGTMVAVVAAGTVVRSIPYDQTGAKHLAWLGHAALMGAVLCPLVLLGGPLLQRAAWYTAGMVGGLSTVAVCAPSEKFLGWAGPAAMGFGVVFMATIGSAFLPPTSALGASLYSVAVYGGLLLFGFFLLQDTQQAIKTAEALPSSYTFDPINAQLRIYMDVLNIFIRLVQILGMGGGSKRK